MSKYEADDRQSYCKKNIRQISNVWWILVMMVSIPLQSSADTNKLTISYMERPPYYSTENGEPGGFLVYLTIGILSYTDISYKLESLPPQRIMLEIEGSDERHCSIGWFKSPEREKFAKFTLAIYQNQRLVILSHLSQREAIRRHQTVNELFLDRSLVMGKVKTFSYGEFVDGLIKRFNPPIAFVYQSQKQVIQMIASGRASYMIISPEEIDTLVRSAGLSIAEFTFHFFEGFPEGNKRYLMCNKQVPDDLIEKINRRIKEQVPSAIWQE